MDNLKNELEKELHIPVALTAFLEDTEMPFLIILCDVDSHGSDDKIFYFAHEPTLELYTETAEDSLISQLSDFLMHHNLKFSSNTTYIPTERMFETIYNIETINKKYKE